MGVMEQMRRYPLGVQYFPDIREEGRVYVDKTDHVYRITHLDSKYIFLSRPRRFGKSLLTSTLRCYFEGRKELFKGLAIEQLETEWTEYPVLHFDMSQGQHLDKEELELYIFDILKDNETRLDVESDGATTNLRLKNLIANAYRKTGKRVVVLIDEYDAPLLDVVNEDVNLVMSTPVQYFSHRFLFLRGGVILLCLVLFSKD